MELISDLADIYDVQIRRSKLPGARGYVQKYQDGYVVLVNQDIEEHTLKRVLMHEMLHIVLGHLDERVDLPLDEKESEVRTALKAMGY